ncbi:MAG: hypothetical protein GY839_04035 [candidate division Zixibacteria bacterium]|nr:hypothetical protein [candidate division Zixibacteria bacterium]
MRKAGLILLVLLAGVVSVLASNQADTQGKQVITSEMINQAGITRLSDIFFLIDDWDGFTIDSFNWRAVANGLNPIQNQNWLIMLDEQEIDIDLFGIKNINMLPVTLSRIDYIEIISRPQIHHGEFVDCGLIHIHTFTPESKLSFKAGTSTGSETGDPGPYRYTEFRTDNVDRQGHRFYLDISRNNNDRYIQIGLFSGWRYLTDSDIRDRYLSISNYQMDELEFFSPSLKIGGDLLGGRHDLFAGYMSYDDFYFLKPYGREIPVEHFFSLAKFQSAIALNSRSNVYYRFGFIDNDLNHPENSAIPDPDWRHRHIKTSIQIDRATESYQGKLGIGIKYVFPKTMYDLQDEKQLILNLYSELKYKLKDRLNQQLGIGIFRVDDNLGAKLSLINHMKINEDQDIDLALAYSERLIGETDNIWYWSERGYDFLNDNGVTYDKDGNIDKSRKFTADLTWRSRPNESVSMKFDLYHRYFFDLYLEQQTYQFDSLTHAISAPIEILSNQTGHVAGIRASLEARLLPYLSNKSSCRFQEAFAGDPAFAEAWETVPSLIIHNTLSYRPVSNFSIQAVLRYRNATRWADYRDVEIQSDGLYRFKVPGSLSLDLEFMKLFRDQKIRGSLAIRNILNDELRYHPMGISLDLRYFVRLEFLFDSY